LGKMNFSKRGELLGGKPKQCRGGWTTQQTEKKPEEKKKMEWPSGPATVVVRRVDNLRFQTCGVGGKKKPRSKERKEGRNFRTPTEGKKKKKGNSPAAPVVCGKCLPLSQGHSRKRKNCKHCEIRRGKFLLGKKQNPSTAVPAHTGQGINKEI